MGSCGKGCVFVNNAWKRDLCRAIKRKEYLSSDLPFWGQRLATEAATAAMRFGFDVYGLDELLSTCQIDNMASERTMQKLGMHVQHETIHALYPRRLRAYARCGDTSR